MGRLPNGHGYGAETNTCHGHGQSATGNQNHGYAIDTAASEGSAPPSEYITGYSFDAGMPRTTAPSFLPPSTEAQDSPMEGKLPWMALYADPSSLSHASAVPGWVDPALIAPRHLTADDRSDDAHNRDEGNYTVNPHTTSDPNSVVEGGRTYHGYEDGTYFLPNDGPEQDRLDFQHAENRLILEGRLYLAPVKEPEHVLDIAAGTGIWAIEFADENPNAKVVGTDLSLIQPAHHPPNCEFIRENSETAEWQFPHKFDLVHLSMVCTCFNEPKRVMEKAFQSLKPGGWIEYFDAYPNPQCADGTLEGTAVQKFARLAAKGALNLGRDILVAPNYSRWLKEVGFVSITELRIPVPINSWPLEKKWSTVGKWHATNSIMGLESIALRMFKGLGISEEETRAFIPAVEADIRNTGIHAYAPYFVVYARKPYDWEVEQMA